MFASQKLCVPTISLFKRQQEKSCIRWFSVAFFFLSFVLSVSVFGVPAIAGFELFAVFQFIESFVHLFMMFALNRNLKQPQQQQRESFKHGIAVHYVSNRNV